MLSFPAQVVVSEIKDFFPQLGRFSCAMFPPHGDLEDEEHFLKLSEDYFYRIVDFGYLVLQISNFSFQRYVKSPKNV